MIWDYMANDGKGGAVDEMGLLPNRFSSPEEEEALALETLGTAGIAGMGPQVCVCVCVCAHSISFIVWKVSMHRKCGTFRRSCWTPYRLFFNCIPIQDKN